MELGLWLDQSPGCDLPAPALNLPFSLPVPGTSSHLLSEAHPPPLPPPGLLQGPEQILPQ